MTFLEAVKIGAAIRPKVKGFLFSRGGSCVMGAAAEGAGTMTYGCEVSDQLISSFPWEFIHKKMDRLICSVDSCGSLFFALRILAVHLNDFHDWDRVRIAEYISQFDTENKDNAENNKDRPAVSSADLEPVACHESLAEKEG